MNSMSCCGQAQPQRVEAKEETEADAIVVAEGEAVLDEGVAAAAELVGLEESQVHTRNDDRVRREHQPRVGRAGRERGSALIDDAFEADRFEARASQADFYQACARGRIEMPPAASQVML